MGPLSSRPAAWQAGTRRHTMSIEMYDTRGTCTGAERTCVRVVRVACGEMR